LVVDWIWFRLCFSLLAAVTNLITGINELNKQLTFLLFCGRVSKGGGNIGVYKSMDIQGWYTSYRKWSNNIYIYIKKPPLFWLYTRVNFDTPAHDTTMRTHTHTSIDEKDTHTCYV
jgi:hypothetical protein